MPSKNNIGTGREKLLLKKLDWYNSTDTTYARNARSLPFCIYLDHNKMNIQ